MPDKTWKSRERMGARFFGAERNPSSGIMSGHTHSDSLHEVLYIEQKSTKKSSIHTLHKNAKAKADGEGKVPVILHHPVGCRGFYVIVHSSNMPVVVSEYLAARGYGLSAEDIAGDSPQESHGGIPKWPLWEQGHPCLANPEAMAIPCPQQPLGERIHTTLKGLISMGIVSNEEGARALQRIEEWIDYHAVEEA